MRFSEGGEETAPPLHGDGEPPAAGLPEMEIRKPGGGLSNFDEIVTPHPVVAFLFRRRTLIVLLGLLALLPFARPRLDLFLAGVALALLAEAWRIWAAGTIHKTEELTTGGPYAHVRHPLYVGSLAHAVAFCLMTARWESLILAVPVFAAVYGAALSTEEQMLRRLFPRQYEEYSRRVPRLLPRLTPAGPGVGRFSWRQVWENKEYINVIWMTGLIILFGIRLVQTSSG